MQLSTIVARNRRMTIASRNRKIAFVSVAVAALLCALFHLQTTPVRATENITYGQVSQAELAMLTGHPASNLTKEQLAQSEGVTETRVVKAVVKAAEGMIVEYWADVYDNESPRTVEDVAPGRVMQPALSLPLLSTTIRDVSPGTDVSLLFWHKLGTIHAPEEMQFVTAISDGERSVRHVSLVPVERFATIAHWGMAPKPITFRYNEPIPIYTMNGLRATDGPAVFSSYRADDPNVQAQLHHIHVVVYVMVTK